MKEAAPTSKALTIPTVTMDAERMERAIVAIDRVIVQIRQFFDQFLPTMISLWERVKRSIVPAKWDHLSKYTKKARTRKKYRNRIERAYKDLLARL